MKKLLFLLLFLPTVVWGQAQPQQSKTPASGTNAGNSYFSWYSGAFSGYFIPPYGSNATLNRAADINGLFYVQLSDSTIRFRYNGSWIPIGKGGSSGAIYFNSTYFNGLGTAASPIGIIQSSLFPSQTGNLGKVLSTDGSGNLSWIAGGGTNIYNSDGTLTGNRVLSGSGYTLRFNNLSYLQQQIFGTDGLGTEEAFIGFSGINNAITFSYGAGDQYAFQSNEDGAGNSTMAINHGQGISYEQIGFDNNNTGIKVTDQLGHYGLVTDASVDTNKMGTSNATYVTSGWVKGRLHSLPGGGTTTNAVTFNNSGSGATSGTTFNGSAAKTISYNTIGAVPTTTTVAGFALSSNVTLANHVAGYGLSGTNYNGATSYTWTADTTSSTGLVSKSRLATNLGGYVKTIGVTTANGVSGTSSGGQTPSLTITLGNITPTTISTTIKPATVYQTATGTAGTDSVMVKHSGGVVNAISPTYYATTSSLPTGANPTATAGATAVNGSATTFMRSDAAPKVDSTVFQTVANFFPKGDTRYLKSSVFNSLTQYSVPIATGSGITQDNSNFYYNYSTHQLSVGTNGDFTGTNAINIYGQLDAYEPQSSIGAITSGTAYPGVTASTSRGTGASPSVNSSGDNAGGFSGWIYTGASPNYLYAAGMSISAQGVTSSLGGQLDFYTKADGSTTTTSAMTITPSGQVKINGGLTAPAKMTLGTVMSNNLLVSTGYTSAGSTTTWAFTSSGLTFSGGSNDNSNTQTYTSYYTNATNYSTSITFKPTAYGNGIGIGLNSNNGQIIGRMSLTSGGTGTLYIDVYRSATIYNKVTGGNTLTFALNDNIQLTLSRFNYDWYLFANDLTSGVSVSCQVNDPLTYGEIAFEWAAANPFILAYGGAGTITNHNLAIGNYVQNDFVIVGNSISVGMQSGSPNNTFASLLGQYYNGGVNLEGGGGNTTSNDVQLLPEIVALHPRFLIFTDGVNDAVSGYSAATSEANMQTIITTCISNNITPVFCTILPLTAAYGGASNSTYQAAIVTLNTYINGLKNVVVIDTYTALASGSVLNASYDSGDGIHINTAGHLQYYNTLYNTLSGNYMVNVTPNPITAILSTSNNWTGNPQTITINGLGAVTSDAWKLVNTTSATSGTPQYSPDILFGGTAYNTTSLASQTFNWKMFATGTAGNPIASNVYLTSSLNGAGYITNQYGWSAVGVYTAPTFSSTSTAGGSAFQSYNASATSSNLYVLAAGGNTLGVAATNFAGASNINYRWFMSGGTAITPGGNNAVTGGIIGTQHVVFPSTGVTPLIAQLVIKPLIVDAGSGGSVTNTATLELEGAATGTVTGANYNLWAHGLNRLDSLATNITGIMMGNGNASPATQATASNLNTAFGSQTANYIYAAPNGSSGNPSFRALVSADIPAGTITPASMQNSDDNTYRALQLLGSSIKGYTVGFPVLPASNAIALTSGTITWTAVYVPVGQTLTGIKVDISTAGSYTSTGYNGVALYSISGGTLTQVATSTTSTTVWTGSGWVSIPFASTYTATEGVYYVALLYQESAQTTAPKINAISTPSGYPALDFTNSYKLGGTSSGTTLPSSQAASGITAASTQYHILLY